MNRPARNDIARDEASTSEEYDYEALEAAVMQTHRGRWFLNEYLRRHQNDETRRMLKALQRLAEASAQFVPAGPAAETPAAAMLESLRLLLADTANRLARLLENMTLEPTPPEMAAGRLTLLLEELPADKAPKALATLRQTFSRMAEVLEEPRPVATPTSDIVLEEENENTSISRKDETEMESEKVSPPVKDSAKESTEEGTVEKPTPQSAPPASGKHRKARIVIHRHPDSRKVSIPLPDDKEAKSTGDNGERPASSPRRAVVRLHNRKKTG